MVDKQTIGISALITLGIVLAGLGAQNLLLNDQGQPVTKYYCQAESSILECPGGLSTGIGTRCYLNLNKTSYDYCSSGWAEITDDLQIQDDITPEPDTNSQSTGAVKYQCDQTQCLPIE